MLNRIFTGNYEECKSGNLISISGDRGKDAGFEGKWIGELAPKRDFFKQWRRNRGVIPEEENNQYYIENYYSQVLSQIDVEALLKDEVDPILLCYEKGQDFCHRHVLAEYIEMIYGVKVQDIKIDEDGNVTYNERPAYIRRMLEKAMAH